MPEPPGPPAGPSAAGETTGRVPSEAPPTQAPLDPGAPPSENNGGAAPPADPPSCSSAPVLGPGNHSLTLQHDGAERSYLVHVPAGIEPTQAVPRTGPAQPVPAAEPTQPVPRAEPTGDDRTEKIGDDRPGFGPADDDPPRH